MPETGHIDPPAISEDEAERQRRTRARWLGWGVAIGIALGFAVTAGQVAWSGWYGLPFQLVWNLIIMPFFSVLIACNRCPVPRARGWSWRRLRLSTRTLMLLIAYVALLFGMGVSTAPLGNAARRYYGKHTSALNLAKVFGDQARKSAAEFPPRLANAASLRAGKIPEGLLPSQKDFLRSLDRTATPEFRAYRYGLIADGEELQGTTRQRNATGFRRLSKYHEALAAKYDRARRRPWLPVAPDPPAPTKW